MRKVIFGGATTLDNYIARKDDSFDWILHSKEANEIMKDYWARIDTEILGRRTYDVAMKMGGGVGYGGIKTYVCSRTLKKIPGKKKIELASDAVGLVKRLKAEEGKDIIVMGGSEIGKSLFEAGLIDELGVNIHPLLLGSGIPLFGEMDRVELKLRECRQLKNGCVVLTYDVVH